MQKPFGHPGLFGAYWLGYRAVGESWALFHEVPERGALIGFCLGALGMLATVLL
ncbi:MAG: hypothetical protein MUW57_24290 [Pseudomonas sp.]|nr:hypothetical protein [Pseudomonas sp.]